VPPNEQVAYDANSLPHGEVDRGCALPPQDGPAEKRADTWPPHPPGPAQREEPKVSGFNVPSRRRRSGIVNTGTFSKSEAALV
jgi:hypothetical protein